MRILVVEDESPIADFVRRGLEAAGYAVATAADGEEGLALARSGEFALALLDVMLPGRSGLEILRELRAAEVELPVILLTARGQTEDKVEGLDLGANDYVTKPFSLDELLARVRAQLRLPPGSDRTMLRCGDLSLDFRRRRVERAGREARLTAREFDLLAYLMRHPNQVLSREQILNAVWGYDFDPGTNVLEVYVGYLRRKLGAVGGPAPIETMRSAGYRLRSDDA